VACSAFNVTFKLPNGSQAACEVPENAYILDAAEVGVGVVEEGGWCNRGRTSRLQYPSRVLACVCARPWRGRQPAGPVSLMARGTRAHEGGLRATLCECVHGV